jgi:hypothetical protein
MSEAARKIAELADMLSYLDDNEKKELDDILRVELPIWTPLTGPQTAAYETPADVLYYGGSAGGGKTDLLLGLALVEHYSSIIFRRQSTQLIGIQSRLLDEILHSRKGWNGQEDILRLPSGRRIEFGSCNNPGEEDKYQGRPHSFKGFDEICHFLESQFRFLSGWKRSTVKGERQRIVCAGNPPLTEEGRWVVNYWGPWLDPQHPKPALPGELRWFSTIAGRDEEVLDGTPFKYKNETITPLSRTFIPSAVQDNPFLMETGYEATLQALPEPLRSQMLMGDFRAGTEDSAWQVLPTAWVEAAMARWKPEGGQGRSMDGVGADVARGGKDKTCVCTRHGNWYSTIHTWPGKDTPDGATAAGVIMSVTRDKAPIHVDGIGIGGSVVDHLRENNIHVVSIIGSESPPELDGEYDKGTGKLKFRNMRSWMYWRFRESLDPKTGENIALPPDSEMKADLCAPHWKLTTQGIIIEAKDDSLDARGNVIPGLCRRLGRSPDKGDTVIYASRITAKIFLTGQNFRQKVRKGSWRSV